MKIQSKALVLYRPDLSQPLLGLKESTILSGKRVTVVQQYKRKDAYSNFFREYALGTKCGFIPDTTPFVRVLKEIDALFDSINTAILNFSNCDLQKTKLTALLKQYGTLLRYADDKRIAVPLRSEFALVKGGNTRYRVGTFDSKGHLVVGGYHKSNQLALIMRLELYHTANQQLEELVRKIRDKCSKPITKQDPIELHIRGEIKNKSKIVTIVQQWCLSEWTLPMKIVSWQEESSLMIDARTGKIERYTPSLVIKVCKKSLTMEVRGVEYHFFRIRAPYQRCLFF